MFSFNIVIRNNIILDDVPQETMIDFNNRANLDVQATVEDRATQAILDNQVHLEFRDHLDHLDLYPM